MDTQTRRLMLAAQVWAGGTDFEARTLELPEPGPGEAVAAIDLATVCGSDIHTVSGRRPGAFPSVLGHEAVGTITATGPGGARDLAGRTLVPGDRVIWSVTVSCGQCERCTAGRTAKCRSLLKTGHEPLKGRWGVSGGYASHILLPRGITLVSVPDAVSDAAAAPAACATATVMAVLEAAGELAGKRVLVSGAGMLGVVACAVASRRGAASVEARDLDPGRLELAREFGATAIRNAGEAARPGTFDVAVELSGAQPAVVAALESLDVGGRLVLAGSVSPGPAVALDPEHLVRSLLVITGVHNYEPRHLQQAMDFLAETRESHDWDSLVAPPLPLAGLGSLMIPPPGRILRNSVSRHAPLPAASEPRTAAGEQTTSQKYVAAPCCSSPQSVRCPHEEEELSMIKLVVLDMAGTTVDEHGDVYQALAGAVTATGATLTAEDLQMWMGADKTEAIAALLELGGVTPDPGLVARQFALFRELLATSYARNPPVALPGVEEALQTLKSRGIKIGLTTGFSRDVAAPLLESLGWGIGEGELLDAVVTSDEVAAGRPAPYMIHRVMEATGVHDVRAVLAGGDTVVDLLAGHHAGVRTLGVLTGALDREQLEAHPHDWVLDSVADLPGVI